MTCIQSLDSLPTVRFAITHTLLLLAPILLLSANSYFVVHSVGNGASYNSPENGVSVVKAGSFLPMNQNIFVRPRSGIETIVKDAWCRFGADTSFMSTGENLDLHNGTVLINSKKSSGKFEVSGPGSRLVLMGAGCLLINVEPNGGFKTVGLFGSPRLGIDGGKEATLLPGNVLFIMPSGKGFGKKVDVVLSKLIESTFLISGFPNAKEFVDQLTNASRVQEKSLLRTYRASVGSAKGTDSFEIIKEPLDFED